MSFQRAKRNPIFLMVAGVILVAAVAFAWWTISPLFIRTTLVEGQNITVPVADDSRSDKGSMEAPATTGDSMGDSVTDEAGGSMDGEKGDMEEATGTEGMDPSETEDEPMSDAGGEMQGEAGGAMDEPMMDEPGMEEDARESMESAESMEPMGPVVLATGNFDRKDDIHYANGQAILAREADGSTVVRLQDLDAANGPDLYVYVSEHADPQNSEELHMGGHNLGSLKATNGSFSYTLDAGIDPTKIKSVVIYCRAFSVVFSTAALQGAQ